MINVYYFLLIYIIFALYLFSPYGICEKKFVYLQKIKQIAI